MTHVASTDPRVNASVDPPTFLWGADEIARALDLTTRQTNHLLLKGRIKSAQKVGGRWCAARSALLREFGAE